MFTPPRCPNARCSAHNAEHYRGPTFFIRRGFYYPKCRAHRIPRFCCKVCGRGFSRQTFRMDYRDHKPHLNAPLFDMLASGMGLRQSGRILKLSRRCTELKARKMQHHLGHLDRNLLDQLPGGSTLQLDEMETFETERAVCPVTLPIVIERQSMLIVAAASAPIRPSGRMSKSRMKAVQRRAKAEGRRRNQSIECLRRVFSRTARYCKKMRYVQLDSDEKTVYPPLARRAFGRRLRHSRYSSKLPRDTKNPLFRINLTNAMARDLNGRLRRRSWLVSKQRQFLDLQLNIFMAFRNYVRPRFNGERETPAQRVGLVSRPIRPQELLGWRQDWGWFSIHPLDYRNSIRESRARERKRLAMVGEQQAPAA